MCVPLSVWFNIKLRDPFQGLGQDPKYYRHSELSSNFTHLHYWQKWILLLSPNKTYIQTIHTPQTICILWLSWTILPKGMISTSNQFWHYCTTWSFLNVIWWFLLKPHSSVTTANLILNEFSKPRLKFNGSLKLWGLVKFWAWNTVLSNFNPWNSQGNTMNMVLWITV